MHTSLLTNIVRENYNEDTMLASSYQLALVAIMLAFVARPPLGAVVLYYREPQAF